MEFMDAPHEYVTHDVYTRYIESDVIARHTDDEEVRRYYLVRREILLRELASRGVMLSADEGLSPDQIAD